MRYCEHCKKLVGTTMTSGQIAVATALLPTIIGFILYIIFYERKCPDCHCPTVNVNWKKEEDYGKHIFKKRK